MSNTTPISLSLDISPIEFAELMYKNTDSNGNLYLADWYNVDCEDFSTCNDFLVKFNWNGDSLDFLIANYNKLLEELKIISKKLDELDNMYAARTNRFIESTNGILKTKQLEATYFIFVAPFDAENEEQLKGQVIGRVGEELCGYEMVRHARRLCKLLSLGAPELLINNEARHLIASIAIYQCGSNIEIKKLGNYEFEFVETISLVMENDAIVSFTPQERYKNAKQLDLHEYGDGEFCKFKLQNTKDIYGVYAWVIRGETQPIYIGEAVNFRKRFNTGYGIISPRNCFVGGQKTNCKMNKVVLDTYKNGQKIDIYFHETKDYKSVEKALLERITTPYNVKNNKR